MKVVAFNGSARKEGNTAILLNIVLDELKKEGIDTELISLAGQNLSGCIACFKCKERKNNECAVTTDPLNSYIAKMMEADGVLLGSPVYFSDITANTKALIERAGMVVRSNDEALARKVGAGVIAVRRTGAIHAFNSINMFFLISQMIIPGSSYWNMSLGKDVGDVRADAEGVATMQTLGRNMAWLLKKTNS